jgi:hypothetical protein
MDHVDHDDAATGDNTRNILLFKPRLTAVARLSDLVNLAKAARSAPPPLQVQEALSAFPKGNPVSLEKFRRHRLRLPYGRWTTGDGTKVLFNRRYEPVLVWRPGANKAERCGPHWVDDIVMESWFYIDAGVVDVGNGSLAVIGRSDLYRALESLIDTWIRGDRAAADALEAWLLGKRDQYRNLVARKKARLALRKAEFKRLREEYEAQTPANPE